MSVFAATIPQIGADNGNGAAMPDSIPAGSNIPPKYVPIDFDTPRDTIWDYGYPVLDVPTVRLDDDGHIKIFACSGLSYAVNKTYDSDILLFHETSKISVIPGKRGLWLYGVENIQRKFGRGNDADWAIKVVMRVITYNYLKTKPVHQLTGNERKFIRNFENDMAARHWRLSVRNKTPYDFERYQEVQKQRATNAALQNQKTHD